MKIVRFGFICICLVLLAQSALPPGDAQAGPTTTSTASSAPATPREGNLVFNGDLEKETSASPPDGWTMWGPSEYKTPANYTRDTTNPHSGKACLRIHHPADTDGYIVSNPEHAIEPREGMMYTVSFWARSDKAMRMPFYMEAYQSLHPAVLAPGGQGGGAIEVATDWKQFTFEYHEGWDFFANRSKYLILVFNPTAGADQSRTLWIDDVSVVERKSTRQGRLADEAALKYPPVEHRLKQGERLEFSVDARKILRAATADAAGISIHRVAGWSGVPYNKQGKYVLAPELEQAVKDLHLPMTRFYGVGDEPFGVKAAIDDVAELCRRFEIPHDHTVLELENQSAATTLAPDQWAAAVKYSMDKGYKFRYWEVANEPYASIWGGGGAFVTAEDYARHVMAVSAAIRKVDANCQVGIAVNTGSLMWCNYALRQAAGAYDFVVGHFYCGVAEDKFEDMVLAQNYRTLDSVVRLNAMIRLYNPGRDVYQYDTEWGMSAGGPKGSAADYNDRNANVVGTLHRAVRLIYYTREDILRGASSWEMFTRTRSPGFGILSSEAPDKRFLIYWLYYYFNRHVGPSVLEMDGTSPYYTPGQGKDKSTASVGTGPLTPVLVTLSKDGKAIYVVAVNGSWDKAVPFRMKVANFPVETAKAVALSQDDMDAKPLLQKKEDAIRSLEVTAADGEVRCVLPPHCAVFLTVE
jgi:hypothetical protein